MRYLVILVSIFFLSATTQLADTKTFTDDASGVSINYPLQWSLLQARPALMAVGAPITNKDNVRANLNIVIQDINFDVTGLEYANAAKDQMGPSLQEFKAVSVGEEEIGGKKFGLLKFYHSTGGTKMLAHQYYYVENNAVYIITCTMATDREAVYEPIFRKMVATFRLK